MCFVERICALRMCVLLACVSCVACCVERDYPIRGHCCLFVCVLVFGSLLVSFCCCVCCLIVCRCCLVVVACLFGPYLCLEVSVCFVCLFIGLGDVCFCRCVLSRACCLLR